MSDLSVHQSDLPNAVGELHVEGLFWVLCRYRLMQKCHCILKKNYQRQNHCK